LQIPLLSGRLFDERDRSDSNPVVIVSEAIQQRFFQGESAVGRQVKLGKQKLEIVGVVGNIRRAGLRDEPHADLYFPFEQNPTASITLFVRTASDSAQTVSPIQAALRTIEPNTIFLETRTLADIASESVGETRLALWLLGIFAAMALALAAIG